MGSRAWNTAAEKTPGQGEFPAAGSRYDFFPDEELWDRFREHDEEAFSAIYLKYFPVLFNYGHQFTRDRDLIKDTIQDLFIYLREKRSGLSPTTSVKFYLYRAYKNRIVRNLRKSLSGWEELDYNDNKGFEIVLSQESNIINALIDEELKKRIEAAFATLTKRQKEIIIYYFYEGFTYQEIASLMGFAKIEYARILMSRTILKLRRELGDAHFMLLFLSLWFPH